MCYADASPLAFYIWQNLRTVEIVNDQTYIVKEDMVGHNTSMRCQAQNLIQGFLYTENLFINIAVPAGTGTTTLPTTPYTTTPITTTSTTTTTPTTTPTTTTPSTTTPYTTTPIPDVPCSNLSGWWLSDKPYAELHLMVAAGPSALVMGFMRDSSDGAWLEVVGRTRVSDYRFLGLTGVGPHDTGVICFSAECQRCSGEEEILEDGGRTSSSDRTQWCRDDNTHPGSNSPYRFRRSGDFGPFFLNNPDSKAHSHT
jgi:hypothetical protein